MSKARSQTSNRMGLTLLALAAMGGVVALASYVKFAPADRIHPEERRAELRTDAPKVDVEQVRVPKPKVNEGLQFDSKVEPVSDGADPHLVAIQGFLREAKLSETVAIEKIRMDGSVAQIYIKGESDLYSGSMDEAAFLLGLRSALGQFKEIEAVELYHGGQKVEELGHFEMTQPMPVVRPEKWGDPTKPTAEKSP